MMKRRGIQFHEGIGAIEFAYVNGHKVIMGMWFILTEKVDDNLMPIQGTRVYHDTLDDAIDYATGAPRV